MKVRIPLLVLLVALATACSSTGWRQVPHDRPFQREAPPTLHPGPRGSNDADWWEVLYYGSFEQFSRLVSPSRYIEPAVGPRPALDVNAFGKVPDSQWFQNRIGRRAMSAAEVFRGPAPSPLIGTGPARGKLMVFGAKTKGATPGLVVVDQSGQNWIVKFDPPAFPQLSSAAEVISTRILHAAGYNVPNNHVVRFRLQDLELSPKARTRDRYNRSVPLSQTELEVAIDLLNPEPDGRIQAMFSRVVSGRPVGPFSLLGTRPDDPNDSIAHEQRRSLRGLWLFYAWINNTDAKTTNSLDVFVEDSSRPGLGYLKHYLLDFGHSLGAAGTDPKSLLEGHAYEVDWGLMGRRYAGVGIYYPSWVELRGSTPYRSVGPFESKVFDPAKWKPRHANPAFDLADDYDTFWAASILARFSPLHVGAAVAAGEYTEPGAAVWVSQVLVERRRKLLVHAFRNMLPLDDPRLDDGQRLTMVDLEALAGSRPATSQSWSWSLRWNREHDPDLSISRGRVSRPSVHLRGGIRWLRATHGSALRNDPFVTVTWREGRGKRRGGAGVDVHLRLLDDGTLLPVAMERRAGRRGRGET